ncbi:mersacidin/lichenicidin family type 2 lantibiotic [Rathayibacter tritici]|uniref:mersacidin/lichenicidin family type 2 lantibiotic n=1 Tax=Rathayibacter tritici TaxID=33888 RepID=UPI00142F37CD
MTEEIFWKDPEYRFTRSNDRDFSSHPSGVTLLTDLELDEAFGGTVSVTPVPSITGVVGCWTVGNTVCNGSCAAFGTNGCCH